LSSFFFLFVLEGTREGLKALYFYKIHNQMH